MEIIKPATAGTMESSDAYIEITASSEGISIQLESVVKAQFGDSICASVQEVLKENGVKSATVRIVDRGALDCVIRARVETAVMRGKGEV